mgnify:FL=1
MSEKISEKRRYNFCCWYAVLGSAEEAALKAGFPKASAFTDAAECLKDSECRKLIAEMRCCFSDTSSVRAGLRRLAFGSCKDAVTLAFADELPPPDVIGNLDLFNVSEIKRVKGGGVEIKLFDRLKALEKLYELEMAQDGRNTAASLIEALSAAEVGGNEDN